MSSNALPTLNSGGK
uniref:Coiled-coil domain containing 38 n=1 Tax=Saimiri boliviensis boliviensis TaxID=39432 RepID=A0A2K6V112_SAIBB